MAKCKKFEGGGIAEGTDAGLDKARKKLPSEEIAALEKAPRGNLVDRATDTVKGLGKRLKENVMGTDEQNAAASERLKKAGYFKAGGSVRSSASKRADGAAIRGKTKGRML